VVLTACGNRRAARCQPCSRVYQADAYQLVKAGLAGGKGVPESVGSHPRLFVTFTAPSFGPVHTRRAEGGTAHPCHPGRLGDRCAHGRRRTCWHRHQEGDPDLGTPLCPDCYDYEAAVVWNALAPRLWKQTTITIGRALARRAGLTAKACKRLVTPEFAKVAEYQARGDCAQLIRAAGLPVPPKSACWFCPFHSAGDRQRMRRAEPELFARACDLEAQLLARRRALGRDPVYLSRFGRPLGEVFAADQGVLFDPDPTLDLATCEAGYCMT